MKVRNYFLNFLNQSFLFIKKTPQIFNKKFNFLNKILLVKENKVKEKDEFIINNIYGGMSYRVCESVLCFFSVLIVIVVNYKSYILKYQQKKIDAGNN